MANFGKAEKVRHHGFSASVLVGTIGMQAVATTARFQIDEGDRQVVAAKEPGEYACSFGFPLDIMIGPPRREAGRNGGCGFQRLLIERPWLLARLAEAFGADRAELAGR